MTNKEGIPDMTTTNPFNYEPDPYDGILRQMIELLLAIRSDQNKMQGAWMRWSDVFAMFNTIGQQEQAAGLTWDQLAPLVADQPDLFRKGILEIWCADGRSFFIIENPERHAPASVSRGASYVLRPATA
jgi:hypothetical protein